MNIVREDPDNKKVLLKLDGRLDLSSIENFKQTVDPVIKESPEHLAIDCSRLAMISSIGLRELILIEKKTRNLGIGFKLVSANEKIRTIIKTAGMDHLLH